MKPHNQKQTNFKYRFGSFELDPQDTTELRLMKDGQPRKIQPKQLTLLVCLLDNYPNPVTCDELNRAGWGYEPRPEDERLTQSRLGNLQKQISLLKKSVLGKDPDMIDWLKASSSYCFNQEVTKEPVTQEPEGAYEDLTFQWILYARESRRLELFFGAFIGLSLLGLVAYVLVPRLSSYSLETIDPRFVMSLIQFIVIGCAFGVSFFLFSKEERDFPVSPSRDAEIMEACGYSDKDKWAKAKESARNSVVEYLSHWRLLLTAWTLLYLIMVLRYSWWFGEFGNDVLSVMATLFNNLNSVAIALCFIVLDQPTDVRTDGSSSNPTSTSDQLMAFGVLGIGLFVVVQSVVVFLKFTGGLSQETVKNIFYGLEVTSGLVGGIALALYVGRVQSKFLGPSTWLPIVLYFYVTIQSLYIAIDKAQSRMSGALIIETALILKCLLFLYVIWLFKSGRFLFYFVRVKTIYERVNPDWKTFFLNLDKRTKL